MSDAVSRPAGHGRFNLNQDITRALDELGKVDYSQVLRAHFPPRNLTPREYALLEYLIRHAGEVLPKADIIGHVWDWEFEGDPNIVEVYVGYLRKKIDTPFGLSTLRTVRGVGYQLMADG